MDDRPTDQSNDERRFGRSGGWQGRIRITGRGEYGFVAGHADLYRNGQYMCKIVLARQYIDAWLAANALHAKAIEWIEDWNRRDHAGDTGFSCL